MAEGFPRPAPRVLVVQEHTFLPRFLGADSVVVDLGANEGAFALAVRQRFACRCYAVEAWPVPFRRIPQGPGLRAFNLAIAAAAGPVTLHVSAQPDGSSICDLPASEVTGHVSVPGVTLSSFLREHGLDRVDLLKMDIEGAEVAVLAATPDDVLRRIGQLTIEFHDFRGLLTRRAVRRVRRRLRRLGFWTAKFWRGQNKDVLAVNHALCPVRRGERLLLRLKIGFLDIIASRVYWWMKRTAYPVLRPVLRRRK